MAGTGGWMARALLAALLHATAGSLRASEASARFLPDYLRLQYAGQSGLLSLGTGYAWLDRRLEAELAYGFVPESAAGLGIHILSQKNAVSLARYRPAPSLCVEPLRVGFAANVSQGERYEVIQPGRHWDYYWPDGLYFWYFAASKATLELAGPGARAAAAVVEVGTVNQYLRAYTSSNSLALREILSLALSAQVYF